MGKLVQVKYTVVGSVDLPPLNLPFLPGETTTLTNREYNGLDKTTLNSIVVIQSGLADPIRSTNPGAPSSATDALHLANAYTDQQIHNLISTGSNPPAQMATHTEVAAAIVTAENFATSAVATEKTRAQNAENALTSSISSKATSADLTSEVNRATAAEGIIRTNLANEVTRAQGAEGTLTTNLSAEVTRAEAAESSINSTLGGQITAETSRAEDAEATLTTAVAAKASASALSTEIGRAEGVEAGLTTGLSTETSRAQTAEGTLTTNLNNEITRAQAAESTLTSNSATTTALNAEISRAQGAETTLGSSLTTEIARAQGAESTNATSISTEITRATGAETTLGTAITTAQAAAISTAASDATTKANAAQAAAIAATGPSGSTPDGYINVSMSHATTYVDPRSLLPATTGYEGGNYIALGDDITVGTDTANAWGVSYPHMFEAQSLGQLRMIRNAGVTGNTIAQMVSRFAADVTAYSPNIVSILAGTNDIIAGTASGTMRSGYVSLINNVRGFGAEPVLITLPPLTAVGVTSTQKANLQVFNQWILRYAKFHNIRVVDIYPLLVDPATVGNWLAGYAQSNGIDPSGAGSVVIAKALFQIVYPQGVEETLGLASANLEATNLATNGLFLNGTSGLSTSWTVNVPPSSGTCTPSLARPGTSTPAPAGAAQRLTYAGAIGNSGIQQTLTTGFVAGDTLEMSVFVNLAIPNGFAQLSAQTVGGTTILVSRLTGIQNYSVLRREFVVPASTTSITISLDGGLAASAVSGTVDFSGMTIRNLTTGSMVTP